MICSRREISRRYIYSSKERPANANLPLTDKENSTKDTVEKKDENYGRRKPTAAKKVKSIESSTEPTENNLYNITLADYKQLTFCPSKGVADFINVQVSQLQNNPRDRRYSNQFKDYCLSLYFSGPKLHKKRCYRDLLFQQ